jgi:hypothetical protein
MACLGIALMEKTHTFFTLKPPSAETSAPITVRISILTVCVLIRAYAGDGHHRSVVSCCTACVQVLSVATVDLLNAEFSLQPASNPTRSVRAAYSGDASSLYGDH